jgi:hypothetical protein
VVRLCLFAVLCVVALIPTASATARTMPGSPPFRVVIVDSLNPQQFRQLAERGAAGLLVPEVGPTTNRRQAVAALVRGAEVNARLGGVPRGRPLIFPSHVSQVSALQGAPDGLIVVSLPPRGAPRPNDRRYPIVVIGRGFHGLLESPTTRIDGLVSIVDVAPTALGLAHGSLSATPSSDPVARLTSLDQQIRANNRLKLPALIIIACAVTLLAAVRPRAAMTAVLGALLVSVGLGAAHVSSEPLILAVLIAGTVAGGVWLSRAFATDERLLALIVVVLALHVVLLALRPSWVAVTPLGPTQNSRFWGIGNQLETLLLAPLLVGALLAWRRFGNFGLAAFSVFGLVLITDNRFGSDGGGAIVFGVACAFLVARSLRLGPRGFATILLLAATLVLALVSYNLRGPGPDHLRSAFGHGLSGLARVVENRVPLSYLPALHNWPLLLPLALWFGAALLIALRVARTRFSSDLVMALGLAIGTSLLVNDSAAYELTGGVAAIAAVVRFKPSTLVPQVVPSFARLPFAGEPVPNEARRD